MRAASIIWCSEIPGLQVYLFRRIREDLVKNHMEGPKGYRELLAPAVNAGMVTIVEDEIRFWNGSKIYLCHCKDEKDRFKYQGAEIHVLLMDELTHFTATIYTFLRSRVRMVGLKLPAKYTRMFPRILCGSNPGNVGHHWVKAAFIDNAVPMELRPQNDNEGGMLRQFIPALLDDNPSMASDDPTYRARLRGLGSAALVKAMEDGDWNVIAGAFFDCWATDKHVIKPCELPRHWTRFRALDWGSYRPFSVGWWAIASEDFIHPAKRVIPKGALIRYREWYGASAPNIGLKMFAEDVASGILSRETGDTIAYSVADPSIFAQDGGPSIAERMGNRGIYWQAADNKRVSEKGHIGGWDQVRARLVGEDGKPMLYVFDTCSALIRTLPALQHDEHRPEDVDSDGEDHAPDEARYACMSRPYSAPTPLGPIKIEAHKPTFNELLAQSVRKRRDD